jgi:hypothetical protein
VGEAGRINAPKEIPHAEVVEGEEKVKKKNKKRVGKKLNVDNFDNLHLDDGVSIEEKEKNAKAYENSSAAGAPPDQKEEEVTNTEPLELKQAEPAKAVVAETREMTKEETTQKLEELKANKNVKSISS